jgi:zinc transporter
MLLAGKLPKRSSLGVIRRDLVSLRRLLAPEPAALFRLVNRPPKWVRDEDIQSLRQSAEEFSLSLRDIDSLLESIKLLEEDIADRVAEHMNRSVLILTAVTVIALPINLLAGLLGMNVGGLPFRYYAHGFWIVAVIAMLPDRSCRMAYFSSTARLKVPILRQRQAPNRASLQPELAGLNLIYRTVLHAPR